MSIFANLFDALQESPSETVDFKVRWQCFYTFSLTNLIIKQLPATKKADAGDLLPTIIGLLQSRAIDYAAFRTKIEEYLDRKPDGRTDYILTSLHSACKNSEDHFQSPIDSNQSKTLQIINETYDTHAISANSTIEWFINNFPYDHFDNTDDFLNDVILSSAKVFINTHWNLKSLSQNLMRLQQDPVLNITCREVIEQLVTEISPETSVFSKISYFITELFFGVSLRTLHHDLRQWCNSFKNPEDHEEMKSPAQDGNPFDHTQYSPMFRSGLASRNSNPDASKQHTSNPPNLINENQHTLPSHFVLGKS